MLYVGLLSFKAGLTKEQQLGGLARRAAYQFPAGMTHVAEYWPAGPTQVVVVFEAESFEPILKITLDWEDIFEIAIYPAVSYDAGLQMGARLMQAG